MICGRSRSRGSVARKVADRSIELGDASSWVVLRPMWPLSRGVVLQPSFRASVRPFSETRVRRRSSAFVPSTSPARTKLYVRNEATLSSNVTSSSVQSALAEMMFLGGDGVQPTAAAAAVWRTSGDLTLRCETAFAARPLLFRLCAHPLIVSVTTYSPSPNSPLRYWTVNCTVITSHLPFQL